MIPQEFAALKGCGPFQTKKDRPERRVSVKQFQSWQNYLPGLFLYVSQLCNVYVIESN